jgi:ABC-type glycerol-3-phosphate transport system substrate-binding protein
MQRKSGQIGLLLLFLAGCQGTLPAPDPPPYAGVVLRVDCPRGLEDLIRTQSRAWQARQDARVEIVEDKSDKADIRLLPPDELPALAARGKLVPVPVSLRERGNAFEWGALLPGYREQLLSWDGTPYALPLLGEAPICLYRADLFSNREHQQNFRAFAERYQKQKGGPVRTLRAPLTWDEFALIAEYFRDASIFGKQAPTLPPLPRSARDLDRLFYLVAASYGRRAIRQDEKADRHHRDEVFSFHQDLKTGDPRLAGPGFVAALAMLQRLQECRPADDQPHPEEAFRDGKAVLCITDASALLGSQQTPGLRDKVGICLVPGSDRYFAPSGNKVLKAGVNRVPYLGGAGWLGAVPVSASNPEAAFDLLADLCGPTRSMQIVLEPRWGGGPIRVDQVRRERWDAFDLDTERSLALKETLSRTLLQHGLKNPLFCLRTPDVATRREALDAGLRAALRKPGEEDPAKVLAGVAKRWKELNEQRGRETARREYRISLGLLGR